MILAIVKLQECSSVRGGRFGFVRKKDQSHGIARGAVRLFEVRADSWAKIRRELKEYKRGVMGFSAVHPETVEYWQEFEPDQPAQCFPGVKPAPEGMRITTQ